MDQNILVPLCGMLFSIIVVSIIFGYTHVIEKRFHATIQRIIESGQSLDENILSGIPGYQKVHPRNDMRTGAIIVGSGTGIWMFGFIGLSGRSLGSLVEGFGVLALCIGAAILIYGYLSRSKNTDLTD